MALVEQDYILRQIHRLVDTLLRLIPGLEPRSRTDIPRFADAETQTEYESLLALAEKGEINGAENRLYERLDAEEPDGLRLALLFYDHLNSFEEERLLEADFSREEIRDGILAAARLYGYGELADALL